jgi:CRP-like cAMP-binding protein
MFDAGRLMTYQAEDTIYLENSPAQGLFGLVEGAVRLERASHAGKPVLLHIAPPGFWFGEVATAGGQRTMITARAFGSVKAWHIPISAVWGALKREPDLFGHFCSLMAGRFAALAGLVSTGNAGNALLLIAARLVAMDQDLRANDSAVDVSVLHMRQDDLADMTGYTRQTVNAAIKRLEREGLIEIGHRQLVILDSEGLASFASSVAKEASSAGSLS